MNLLQRKNKFCFWKAGEFFVSLLFIGTDQQVQCVSNSVITAYKNKCSRHGFLHQRMNTNGTGTK